MATNDVSVALAVAHGRLDQAEQWLRQRLRGTCERVGRRAAAHRRSLRHTRLTRRENVARKKDNCDEEKNTRTQNRDQSRAQAGCGQKRSSIVQIGKAGPPGRQTGKDAFVDQDASGDTAL
jgi:hypothetical protein